MVRESLLEYLVVRLLAKALRASLHSMASKCPICKAPSKPYAENKSAPFCGPRCKLADLHSWLDGRYAIPDNSPPGLDAEYDDGETVH